MSFRLVPVGDLVEKVAIWNPAKQVSGEFDYIDLSAVDQNDKCIVAPNRIPALEAPSRARQIVRSGDVLVSTVRPNLNGVAKAVEEHDGMTASTGFCVLRPAKLHLDANYLFQWVKSPAFVDSMVRKATGASYPAVSDRIIKNSEIPLPPLSEQKRIAAILDKADALRRKRRQAIALLDSLTQSIFLEMFNLRKRADFKIVHFEEVTTRITYGFTRPMSHHESGIPILTAKNIQLGYIAYNNIKYTNEADFVSLTDKSKPEPGDILITKDGTIGRCAIFDRKERVCINQSVCLVKLKKDAVQPLYILHYLLSAEIQRRIDSMKKGNSMPHLQITELAKFPVPLPSNALQCKFIERLGYIETARQAAMKAEIENEDLFSSLQHRAFSGQL